MMTPPTTPCARADLFSGAELSSALGLLPEEFDRITDVLGLGWKRTFTLDERDNLREVALGVDYTR